MCAYKNGLFSSSAVREGSFGSFEVNKLLFYVFSLKTYGKKNKDTDIMETYHFLSPIFFLSVARRSTAYNSSGKGGDGANFRDSKKM